MSGRKKIADHILLFFRTHPWNLNESFFSFFMYNVKFRSIRLKDNSYRIYLVIRKNRLIVQMNLRIVYVMPLD